MNDSTALIIVDLQNGFMPNGGLPVPFGDEVVPVINELAKKFSHVVLTQDWHPANHISFAVQHEDKAPFETIMLPYGEQTLWPVHCVQNTFDALLHKDLNVPHAQLILRKGFDANVDSYSAFADASRHPTGLGAYLHEKGITSVYLCGLATDYCVSWSAIDARNAGFQVSVIEDACRAIDLNGSLNAAWEKMLALGIKKVQSSEIHSSE